MKFEEYSYRHALDIISYNKDLNEAYEDFKNVIRNITDEDLKEDYNNKKEKHEESKTAFKSLTSSINNILKERLVELDGWKAEVDIFDSSEQDLGKIEWRLDFVYNNKICVEVAFNHREAIAWNLIKPVLACELNPIKKKTEGTIGIYVCADDQMKIAANMDGATGSFETVKKYLKPMESILISPIVIIGLKPFDTFKISKDKKIIEEVKSIDKSWENEQVIITDRNNNRCKGTVVEVDEDRIKIKPKSRKASKSDTEHKEYTMDDLKFIEKDCEDKKKRNKK